MLVLFIDQATHSCKEGAFVLFFCVPKISDEKRAARRLQILDAAWRCFQQQGLHATTMDDIIRAAGLSAGAVYSYFPGKEALIEAAVTHSLSGLSALAGPILAARPGPALLVEQFAATLATFAARDGYDLRRIALLGWAETQRNRALRALMAGFYLDFRTRLAALATHWQQVGAIGPQASPGAVAKTLLAAILGFVVQSAILADVSPQELAQGIAAVPPAPGSG